jgi:peptidyl-tRNA hydrolase, PTH1 family
MSKSKRLIVGLGNPGPAYEGTRHNVGFDVADAVAKRARIELVPARGDVLLGWGRVRGFPLGVAKPLTFMNRSGRAVRALLATYGLHPSELLLVVDDVHLILGKIRIRAGGSAGGHNGLQDVVDALGTVEVPRLRIGIGGEFQRGRQAEYVLSPFLIDERPVIEEAIVRASDAAITFVSDGVVAAMNRFN